MKLFDISWTVSEQMTVYKDRDEKRPRIRWARIFKTDKVNESNLSLDSHTGTHVDAPLHFIAGAKSIHRVSLDSLVGICTVLDCTKLKGKITAADLKKVVIRKGEIILFKTKNSARSETAPFAKDFVFLEKSGAALLAKRGVKAVGIDYLGIERDQPEHDSHTALLKKGIPVIEGLRLAGIRKGRYTLICLPLKVKGADAAPARAILVET